MEWAPLPLDIHRGSSARGMKLPAIAPPNYGDWPTHQQGMFWNLFWALWKAEGYLPFGSDLWKLTGALTRERWDANSSAVLSAFEFLDPDASGSSVGASGSRQIFYRPLLQIIEFQKQKFRKSTAIHSEAVNPLSLPLAFDLEVQNQKREIKKPRSILEREEKDRRSRLSEITRRGLRDYSKYPVESWEKPQAMAAAGD